MKVKIQIVKKGGSKVKLTDPCPWLVEIPPEAIKK
jgi:hypothetical protein